MVSLEASFAETSEVVMPDATTNLGRALGGWVLERMDLGGGVAPHLRRRGRRRAVRPVPSLTVETGRERSLQRRALDAERATP